MQLRNSFYDHDLDTPCFVTTADGMSTVCAPSGAATVQNLFIDADCSRPALSTTDPTVRYAEDYSFESGCSEYYRLGNRLTTPVFESVAGVCVATTVQGSVFEIGAPIGLPTIENELAKMQGRLAPVVARGIAGMPMLHVIDTELQSRCFYFEDFSTGEGHCTPVAWDLTQAFADAGCVQPIEVSVIPARTCDGATRFANYRFKKYREIAEPLPEAFTKTMSGECVRLGVPPGHALHALGRTILPEDLVAGHFVIDDVKNHEP